MDDYTAFGYRPFIPAARPACEPASGGRTGLSTAVLTADCPPPMPFPDGTPLLTESVVYPDAFLFPQTSFCDPAAFSDADSAFSDAAFSDTSAFFRTGDVRTDAARYPYAAEAPDADPHPAGRQQDPHGEPVQYGETARYDEPEPPREQLPQGEPGLHDRADRPSGGSPGGPQRPRGHRRRRHRAARSAVFTLAVPSVAVLGVTAAAVAGVAATHRGSARPAAAASSRSAARPGPDPGHLGERGLSPAPAGLDRPRADLEQREEAQRRQAVSEAAQQQVRERPRFVLPVDEHGLSAYFGQVGLNWMSFHTGIDFPVDVGTPVRAATDGRVSTAWSPAYGNIVKVTAPDGTQTWYCHLSRTRVRSGPVQAGEVIAYSGNTGNTTGPHLHFEVRPGGGDPVDPLPWLLGHNLDPR